MSFTLAVSPDPGGNDAPGPNHQENAATVAVFENCSDLSAIQLPDLIDGKFKAMVRLSEISDPVIIKNDDESVNTLREVLVQDRLKNLMRLYGVVGNDVVAFLL